MATLKAGQIIRYDSALWRVEYVNSSRARIVPLLKRHVVLKNDEGQEMRAFDTDQRGASISPNSLVEVVSETDNLEAELEMVKLEKEIAQLKAKAEQETAAEAARLTKQAAKAAKAAPKVAPPARSAAAPATPAAMPAPANAEGLTPAPSGARGAGWYLIGQAEVIPGSLKAQAIAYVGANPGKTTKQVAEQITGWNLSAVAACLDRFRKAGVMVATASLATAPGLPAQHEAKAEAKPESTDF